MKTKIVKFLSVAAFVAMAVGCQNMEVKKEEDKNVPPTPVVEEKAAQPVEPPPPPPSPRTNMTIEQKQALRDMERELLRDVGDYWKLVKERNVEKAVEFVTENHRDDLQQDLWKLISLYSVESTEIVENNIKFPAEQVSAEVSLHHLLYDKKSRAFKTQDEKQMWAYGEGKWSLLMPEKPVEPKE